MKNTPARLWIMPAREAPVALVIRRKPHKVWHFLCWDTMRGTVTSGDWRWGIFYPKDCDVSWDGRLWAYHGDYGERGCGVAPVASLDPLATWYSQGAWDGGGFFESPTSLRYLVPSWEDSPPLILKPDVLSLRLARESATNVPHVLSLRQQRDGWQSGDVAHANGTIAWQRPSASHPRLVMAERRTKEEGEVYAFSLPDHPKLLDAGVFRATYDARGDLLIARRGVLERYTLDDIGRGIPSFSFNLNEIAGAPSPDSLKRYSRELWASEREGK